MDAQALGRYLRESREAREKTLEDAEQALRIRRYILEAFEIGDFNVAGASQVQIRGFIRNYARYLGLDEERVVVFYESALENGQRRGRRKNRRERSPQRELNAPRSITDTNPSLPKVSPAEQRASANRARTMLNSLVMTLVGLASLAVIIFVLFQIIQAPQQNNDTPFNVIGDLPSSPTFTAAPTFTPRPSPEAAVDTRVIPTYSGRGVLVSIEMTQRAWIRFVADDIERYAGIAPPGTTLTFSAENTIAITASNAQALNIIYNGQQQGMLGGRGQRIDITFTPTNMQLLMGPGFAPTAEFSPTPLPTSDIDVGALIEQMTPSITPGPSPTATATFTPSLTPSITFTPSITPTPSDTPTATSTPTETFTPGPTATATDTPTITPTPSATAILPPRVPAEEPTPTKTG
jgi:cytoskeletal protein RodZ